MASRFDTGIIFDFDGTLIDSEAIHFSLYRELAGRMGYRLTEDEYRQHLRGRTDTAIIDELRNAAGCCNPLDALVAAKQRRFVHSLARGAARAVPGAVPFVRRLAQKGYRLAVASSATLDEVRLGLQSIGIFHFFRGVISAESVKCGKPNPEPYIRAAAMIGFSPHDCIAYEDSLSGVTAAADAGMLVIGVGRMPRPQFREAGAVEVIPDFNGHILPREQVYGYLEENEIRSPKVGAGSPLGGIA